MPMRLSPRAGRSRPARRRSPGSGCRRSCGPGYEAIEAAQRLAAVAAGARFLGLGPRCASTASDRRPSAGRSRIDIAPGSAGDRHLRNSRSPSSPAPTRPSTSGDRREGGRLTTGLWRPTRFAARRLSRNCSKAIDSAAVPRSAPRRQAVRRPAHARVGGCAQIRPGRESPRDAATERRNDHRSVAGRGAGARPALRTSAQNRTAMVLSCDSEPHHQADSSCLGLQDGMSMLVRPERPSPRGLLRACWAPVPICVATCTRGRVGGGVAGRPSGSGRRKSLAVVDICVNRARSAPKLGIAEARTPGRPLHSAPGCAETITARCAAG